MTEVSEEKEIKNKLAVFEHVRCKEKKPSVRDTIGKRGYKRCQSPSSDNDLVIDDEQPPRKRNKGVRMVEEPLELFCSWEDCKTVITDYSDFIYHIKKHLNNICDENDVFSCLWEGCKYETSEHRLLVQHMCYHGYHTKLKNIGKNVLERNKLPNCNQDNVIIFPIHVFGYSCEWENCGSSFNDVYTFYGHIRQHIHSNPTYCKNNETISCLWRGCSYKFPSQYKLSDHIRTHTKERVAACPTCGAMFSTKTKFYDHRKRQLPIEVQNYQCSQCSKLFPSERLLRDHMRSHINHYKCTMCDMTCPKPSALAKHFRYRHLPERPIQCKICDHACLAKHSLEAHMKTHSEEKLYACEECDYRCRSLYGLDKHCYNEHGQDWTQTYECHCCQAQFQRGNYLTKHLMSKHNFHWPSGHSRFLYKEDRDGIFRLQTVRYESIEVTQEMMRTNSSQQVDISESSHKYNLRKRQQPSDKTPNYVLMVAENGEQNVGFSTDNNILITINDIDEKGNIINSEILQSKEMKILSSKSKKN
ncbi:hypothetical protein FQA39_LY08545 [Lamprigera yunnana]|nr:hypothetical protein FQA39_LY08545 [Lamprigera yunnana]